MPEYGIDIRFHLQATAKKDAGELYLLVARQIQPPQDWQWYDQNGKVCDDIQDPVDESCAIVVEALWIFDFWVPNSSIYLISWRTIPFNACVGGSLPEGPAPEQREECLNRRVAEDE